MLDWIVEFFRSSYPSLYIATFVVAAFLFLSGLDDVFVDMYYWFHHTFSRKKFNKVRYDSPEAINKAPEKPTAIFVPAWHEYEVIDKMLVNACRTVQYQ